MLLFPMWAIILTTSFELVSPGKTILKTAQEALLKGCAEGYP